MNKLYKVDYLAPQLDKSEMLRLFNSPENILKKQIKLVTHFRHESDLIYNQGESIVKMHTDAYENRKSFNPDAKKNIYCAVIRNPGYIRPNFLWRRIVPSEIKLQTNPKITSSKKKFRTKSIKFAYRKAECSFDLEKLFSNMRIDVWEREVVEELEKHLFNLRILGMHLANQSKEHFLYVKMLLEKHPNELEEFISIRKEIYK